MTDLDTGLDQTANLLDRIASWRLTADAWAGVDEALDRLDAAVDAGELTRILEAVSDIELAGPVRGVPDLVTARPAPEPRPIPPLIAETVQRIGGKVRRRRDRG